jgi:alcohol dehydrogenase class IV
LEAIKQFGGVRQALLKAEFSLAEREALLYVSLLGGAVIAQTATTAVHALGYSLTYFRGIPHGRANGLLLAEYLRYNESAAPEKIRLVLSALDMASINEFGDYLGKLLPCGETFTVAELEKFAQLATLAANTANTPRQPNLAELQQILAASLPIN